jgi:hypothetical protein
MSKAQIKALLAALNQGGALNSGVSQKNGSNLRMIKRMVLAGLLLADAPHLITEKGKQALRDANELQDQTSFRIRSCGTYADGKEWARFHGDPIIGRAAADRRLAELAARTKRVYGSVPAPFAFEVM